MIQHQLLQANIIELLEIEDFPDEKKYELIEKSVDLVQKRVFVRVLEVLAKEQRDQLLVMLEKEGNADERASFLERHCPKFIDFLEEEIMKIKEDLRGIVERVKGMPAKPATAAGSAS